MMMTQYGLTHISAGELLRAEVATGTDDGKKAQEYMQKGMLVPNEIVVTVCMYPSCLCSYLGSSCHGHNCLLIFSLPPFIHLCKLNYLCDTLKNLAIVLFCCWKFVVWTSSTKTAIENEQSLQFLKIISCIATSKI
jgi:hypothetical protein